LKNEYGDKYKEVNSVPKGRYLGDAFFLFHFGGNMITRNFKLSEFQCPCCGKSNISLELVQNLQRLRDLYGDPIMVTSGVRCEKENRRVGGYWDSPHLKGLAVDIVARISPVTMAYLADSLGVFRMGIYDTHLHLDIVKPKPSKYWLVKGNNEPVYSGNETDLNKFLRGKI
jgi:hypothetical protein